MSKCHITNHPRRPATLAAKFRRWATKMPMKIRFVITLIMMAILPISVCAADYANWQWSSKLPHQITTGVASKNRTSEKIDKLFKHTQPTTLKEIISYLGRPDAFSPQAMYSKTMGTSAPSRSGGTLRFMLKNGGEVQVWTPNYQIIGLAIRYDSKGHGHILFK